MDIKKYIASGILELYVMGKLSDREVEEVAAYASKYPEVKTELTKIEESLEALAMMSDRTPPPGTLENILQRIDTGSPAPTTGSARPDTSSSSAGTNPWTILFLVAALAAAGLAFWQYQSNQQLAQVLEQERLDRENADAVCDSIAQDRQRLQAQVEFLQDINTRSIIMNGTDNAPGAVAAVFYNPDRKQAYLGNLNLPAPPTGKQYQLWALVDGTPVDMGVFDLDIPNFSSPVKTVPFIEGAGAFAVTLEDEGGKPTPDLTQLFVIGNFG